MAFTSLLKTGTLFAGLAAPLALGIVLSDPAMAQNADIKKHETSPGGQYAPSLDVLKDEEIEQPGAKEGVPVLSKAEFERANEIYFQRCAGCHGVLRKGATGKALTPDVTKEQGFEYLRDFINYGSPAGMPNWGTSGDMTEGDIELMAKYLLNEPAQPPEFGMDKVRGELEAAGSGRSAPDQADEFAEPGQHLFRSRCATRARWALISGDSKEIISTIKDRLRPCTFPGFPRPADTSLPSAAMPRST